MCLRLFSDMKLVGRKQQIDLAFLPIGDYYTMGPDDAAYAASLIDAKKLFHITSIRFHQLSKM